jgi:hypothetical protein
MVESFRGKIHSHHEPLSIGKNRTIWYCTTVLYSKRVFVTLPYNSTRIQYCLREFSTVHYSTVHSTMRFTVDRVNLSLEWNHLNRIDQSFNVEFVLQATHLQCDLQY